MKLNEEKTLLFIEAFVLLTVALTTVFIDLANNKIGEWQYKIIRSQNRANNLLINCLNARDSYQYCNLFLLATKGDPGKIAFNNADYKWLSPEMQKSFLDYQNGKISNPDFIRVYAEYNNNESSALLQAYNGEKIYLDELLKAAPRKKILNYSMTWDRINSLLKGIQMFSIVFAAFGNLWIFKKIKGRSNK